MLSLSEITKSVAGFGKAEKRSILLRTVKLCVPHRRGKEQLPRPHRSELDETTDGVPHAETREAKRGEGERMVGENVNRHDDRNNQADQQLAENTKHRSPPCLRPDTLSERSRNRPL